MTNRFAADPATTIRTTQGITPSKRDALGVGVLHLTTLVVIFQVVGVLVHGSAASGPMAIAIALWELSLGAYLIVKSFKPSPIPTPTTTFPAAQVGN